jgi:hypothetical protein
MEGTCIRVYGKHVCTYVWKKQTNLYVCIADTCIRMCGLHAHNKRICFRVYMIHVYVCTLMKTFELCVYVCPCVRVYTYRHREVTQAYMCTLTNYTRTRLIKRICPHSAVTSQCTFKNTIQRLSPRHMIHQIVLCKPALDRLLEFALCYTQDMHQSMPCTRTVY